MGKMTPPLAPLALPVCGHDHGQRMSWQDGWTRRAESEAVGWVATQCLDQARPFWGTALPAWWHLPPHPVLAPGMVDLELDPV